MIDILKDSIWKQFGATIDMLYNAIAHCSDEQWDSNRKLFYHAYHVLFFLDYYLTIPPKDFVSPLPYTFAAHGKPLPEGPIDDIIPNRIYTRIELLEYVNACRKKCRHVISSLTADTLNQQWVEEEPWGRAFGILELLLYNMRHVQHHAAQMNLLLRQHVNDSPDWVSRAADTVTDYHS